MAFRSLRSECKLDNCAEVRIKSASVLIIRIAVLLTLRWDALIFAPYTFPLYHRERRLTSSFQPYSYRHGMPVFRFSCLGTLLTTG